MAGSGRIRAGIGGWTFDPWEGTFYPDKLPAKKQLEYASRQVTAIEINGTYYRTQSPATYAKWAADTPEDFVFSVKALMFTTNRKVLGEAGESVGKFINSGLDHLGDKLGPILWQFAPTKQFDREDFGAFLSLLPKKLGEKRLRHALEVRNPSFKDPAFVDLCRDHGVAVVFADSDKYPEIADVTADFVYARLESAREEVATGYTGEELDRWVGIAREWAQGGSPESLPRLHDKPVAKVARDVFVFMINGAKVRAPAAAKAFLERV